MGLFDDTFDSAKPKQLSKAEAYAGILVGATAADGHISDEESAGLVTMLTRMRLYESVPPDRLGAMLNKQLAAVKRDGIDKHLENCARVLPEELKGTVFANACDLALADGVVEEDEKELINKLFRLLGLSGDDAKTIAQVMVIKNKG